MMLNLRSQVSWGADYGAAERLFTNNPSITKITQFHLLCMQLFNCGSVKILLIIL